MEMLDDPRTSPITAFGSRFAPRLDHSLLKTQTTVATSSLLVKDYPIPSRFLCNWYAANSNSYA